MKVGINILNFGPGVSPEALRTWAVTAESLGYHSVMISDHVAIVPSVKPRYPEPFYDPFTVLAWLAGQTQRVQLGTTVCVLPYRHPVLTARLVANIDQLSGGRFIFGVGVGNPMDEFKVLGVPHERRGPLGNECLRAILALWSGEGPVSFHGRLVDFEDVSAIRPHQDPHPPIWVGGVTEAALKRTVRFGDAWHPIPRGLAGAKQGLDDLQRLAEAAGRPVPAFCPRIRLDIRHEPIDGERAPGAGSYDQVRSDIKALASMGAEHLILDWNTGDLEATRNHAHGLHEIALLADEVFDLEHERLR